MESCFTSFPITAEDPHVRALFQQIRDLRKNKRLTKFQVELSDSSSEEGSQEENEEADEGESSKEDENTKNGGQDVEADMAKNKKNSGPSSGSGRTKERVHMDLINVEIKELEEQLKYHDVCFSACSILWPQTMVCTNALGYKYKCIVLAGLYVF